MRIEIRRIVGIDPGLNGGVAALDVISGEVLYLQAYPNTFREFKELMRHITCGILPGGHYPPTLLFIEHEHSAPGNDAVSSFSFGRNYQLVLDATDEFDEKIFVRPIEWQCLLGCRTRGKKAVTRAKAKELFPGAAGSITDATADALLIAEYGRRKLFMAEKREGRRFSLADYGKIMISK